MSELRPNQVYALDEINKAIAAGYRNICVTSPTGGGKSRIMYERLAGSSAESSLYTDRRMLLEQIARGLDEHGIEYGFRAAGKDKATLRRVQLSMVQTEGSRAARDDWAVHAADQILIDELHKMGGDTMCGLLQEHRQQRPNSVMLGFTATPLGIGHMCDHLIQAGTVSELRAIGALVMAHHYGPDEPDMKWVGQIKVDGGECGIPQPKRMEYAHRVFGRVVENYNILNPERRPGVLFAPGVAESLWFAQELCRQGISAAHIDGENCWIDGESHPTSDDIRQQILDATKDGRVKLLCNRFVCLDSKTEILTNKGWTSHSEMTPHHRVANWNADRPIWFSPPTQILKRKRERQERMVVLENGAMRVTEDHELLVQKGNRFIKKRAGLLTGKRCTFPDIDFDSGVTLGTPVFECDDFRDEWVWCVETESGNIITKRGSSVVVMGNCREGIDAPWWHHCVIATVFGSLTSYLQAGGRMLRAAPGKDHCTIQDHGGCLDEQTEILTRRGWMGIDDIRNDDTIGTMNVESGDFEWSMNLGTTKKPRDGAMLELSAVHINMRITDYHNMVYRADTRTGAWKKAMACSLANRNSNWIVPVSCVENVEPSTLTDDEIGFIGWFLTDGTIEPSVPHPQRGHRNRIRISQSENAPQKHHDHIVKCIEGCGFDYSKTSRTRPMSHDKSRVSTEVIYGVSSGRKKGRGFDRLSKWLHKDFPIDAFELLDSRQFGVLLNAMNLGNGCKHDTYNQKTMAIAVPIKDAADRIQSLAVRRGFRCNVAIQQQDGHKPMHIVRVRKSTVASVAKGAMRASSAVPGERVWCVETATGTIITRRSGKVAIMGNSWHRFGSLNADREWDLGCDDRIVAGIRAKRIRERQEPEPIVCPRCYAIRLSGPKCHKCGFEYNKRVRSVLQKDGTLRPMNGDIFRARRQLTHNERLVGEWTSRIRAIRKSTKKTVMGMTFSQAEKAFARDHNWGYPPHTLPMMPLKESDWFIPVRDVPIERLSQ